ncbi:Mitochondrial folate transporter/carrier [Nibea albiflora]|uniref:Mitochondrial folate transporter/carrier n=1 Tax=Nibea albiflora TaxID=240163 RepID=A0ACB7F7Y1_NIBAL|nr:Mitochondrial folate transporter/carrier [Nibea albiflora]
MSSAPNHGAVNVADAGLSRNPVPALSIAGHAKQVFSHVRIENLVAGLSGGVVSTLVLHPLDLVKISYNAIKGYAKENRQTDLSATEHLVSAAGAGMLTLTLTNPIWVTKTRLVLQYNTDPTSKQYKGMIDALVKIYRYEGVSGLYKGYVPGLFGTSHGALQFMAYEELKRDYNKYKKVPSDAKLNALEYITMAALSKIFAVATTYPYQVVRARLQDQHNKYNGVIDVVRRTWRNEGAIGFYKGIIPNVIRVTPACCITFLVYENVSRFLGQNK